MTTTPDIKIPTTTVTDDNSFSPVFIRRLLAKLSGIIAIDQEQDPAAWAEEWHMLQQFFWALKPTNPVDAVLAARVVDAHHRGMEISRRAAQPDLSDEKFHRLHTSANAAARALSRLEKRQHQASPAEPEPLPVPLFSPTLPVRAASPLNGSANNRAARRAAAALARKSPRLTG
jgi:hypothetical protein